MIAVSPSVLVSAEKPPEQPGMPVPFNPVFDSSFRKGLYKATMDIGKHHLSGLVYIKKMNDSTFRMLFNNEIGMKFFDLEVSRLQFIIHSCYSSLDRKELMSVLKYDLRMLFFLSRRVNMVRQELTDSTDQNLYKIKSDLGTWRCFVTDEKNISRIESEGKMIRKTRINLNKHPHGNNRQILIMNPTIGLTIHLKMISN
jgi:hypothetical protein